MERTKAEFSEKTKQIEIQYQEKESFLKNQLKDEMNQVIST